MEILLYSLRWLCLPEVLRWRLSRGFRSYDVTHCKPEVKNSTERHPKDTVVAVEFLSLYMLGQAQGFFCLFFVFLIGGVLSL